MVSEDLLHAKKAIILTLKSFDNVDWWQCISVFEFLPFVNKGRKTINNFYDRNLERLDIWPNFKEEFIDFLYEFVIRYNQKQSFNQIIFKCTNHDFENATIELVFNKKIDDDFQNSLPKSKRGKIIPWYVSEQLLK